jgi:hypothetical protein
MFLTFTDEIKSKTHYFNSNLFLFIFIIIPSKTKIFVQEKKASTKKNSARKEKEDGD